MFEGVPAATRGGTLILVLILASLQSSSGSHFRYGTLSWQMDGNSQNRVKFNLLAAYRRDYKWGSNFQETWSQTSSTVTDKVFYGNEYVLVTRGFDTNPAAYVSTNPGCDDMDRMEEAERRTCFDCPANSTATEVGCVNIDPNLDIQDLDTNNNGVAGERFELRFPPKKQKDFKEVVTCDDPFHCDVVQWNEDLGDWINNTEAFMQCQEYEDNPDMDERKCAAWHQVYGMYMGDGTSKTVTLTVTQVTSEIIKGPAVGNFLLGKSAFTHDYNIATQRSWIAYFTGGDRVYECDGGNENVDTPGNCLDPLRLMLNNNAEGRFRLEIAVRLLSGYNVASPWVTMIPVIPLPRGTQDAPKTRFQVTAYDPDDTETESEMYFRMGSRDEYGGIMRSKSAMYPILYKPNGEPLYPDFVYGPFGCDFNNKFYVLNGTCPLDREPEGPRAAEFMRVRGGGVPGLIEWDTFNTGPQSAGQLCPKQNGACTKLRTGLYNFVVMVEDRPTSVEVRRLYQQDDQGLDDVWMSKAPLDFMAYLYDGPMFYCNQACRNSQPGAGAFASISGMYGVTASSTGCSVCGTGPGAELNNSNCVAAAELGPCAELANDDVTLVPPVDVCVQNRAPRFLSPTGKFAYGGSESLQDTPEVSKWERANEGINDQETQLDTVSVNGGFSYPSITQYFGTTVEFYVTVYDPDECTDLSLESTHLPESGGQESQFGEYIPRTENLPNDEGTMVSRLFTWEAVGADEQDMAITVQRDPTTLVCFVATDDYFATADPFYCVRINLKPKPAAEEQTLLRFDCKMSLLWSPVVQRFVFAENTDKRTRKYYTLCRYDNYMWHHAMVAVNEMGVGQLYVDGQPQQLMIPNSTDLSLGFDPAPLDTYFETTTFPNDCSSRRRRARSLLTQEGGVEADAGVGAQDPDRPDPGARRLAQERDPLYSMNETYDQLNDLSDQPVSDMFAPSDSENFKANTECCSFSVAMGCDGASKEGSYHNFEGFIDEVAVWSRRIGHEEVKSSMFKMPAKERQRDLEAARGVQVDYTAGRVLYARFNNPCMESPQQAPPPPFPPPEMGEGNSLRRRLRQISNHEIELFDGGERPWSPPPPIFGADLANYGRREYVSDKAGYTSGWRLPNGTLVYPTDTYDPAGFIYRPNEGRIDLSALLTDALFLRGFPFTAKYVYTGVPWEAPFVTGISTLDGDEAYQHGNEFDGPLPVDGGVKVRVSGFGFARSAFAKCVLVQPDPAGVFRAEMAYTNPDDEDTYEYNNYYRGTRGRTVLPINAFKFDTSSQVVKTPARVVFGEGLHIPYISNYDFHSEHTETAFDLTLDWVRGGEVNAFQEDPNDSHRFDFIYGSWEIVECTLPSATFPSKDYVFGVSNDAGITGSPAGEVGGTFMDYSIFLNGASSIRMEEAAVQLGSEFTISFWVYPTTVPGANQTQQLLELGGGNGIVYDEGVIMSQLDSYRQTPFPSTNQTHAHFTEPNMWHHVVFVADGTTASFYMDNHTVFGYGGASSTRKFTGFSAAGPGLLQFGLNFVGYIDEVKMWTRAVGLEEFTSSHIMFAREVPSQSTGVFAYYRFNNLSQYNDTRVAYDEFGQLHGEVQGMYEYHPMAVPWEPSTIYTINSVDVLTEHDIMKESHHALDVNQAEQRAILEVEGFNFARAFSTGCFWGETGAMKVPAEQRSHEQIPFTCDVPEGEELDLTQLDIEGGIEQSDNGETLLGRPDNRSSVMFPYPANFVTPSVAMTSVLEHNNTHLQCHSARMSEPQFAVFSAGNVPTLNTYPFEFTEVALKCEGDNYLSADEVSSMIGREYTMGAWVLPEALMEEEEEHDHQTAGLKVSTVLAFESTSDERTVNNGLLMYGRGKFFYYDDCIKDVTQIEFEAPAGEWHFVMVSVMANGTGLFSVDGNSKIRFTTTCRPENASRFSVCQDYEFTQAAGETASSHFRGLVDRVMVFNATMSFETMDSFMFNPSPDGAPQPVAHFDFADPSNMLPHNAVHIPLGELSFSKSTGPWLPATVVGLEPEESDTSGGTLVSVFGTNFAPSQWLRVNFGGEHVRVETHLGSGVTARTTPMHECGTHHPVLVANGPGVETMNMLDANVAYESTVSDLAKHVFSRFTFDYVEGATFVTNDTAEASILAFDLAAHGPGRAETWATGSMLAPDRWELDHRALPALGDDSTHFMVPMSHMVSDKDLFQRSAVEFGASFSVAVPVPEHPERTVCAWLFMFINEQAAPYAGGWKLACLVTDGDGETTVFLNAEMMEGEDAAWYEAAFADNSLGGEMESGYLGDLWVYSRALLPCDVAARYYTQEYALDFTQGRKHDDLLERPAHVMLPIPAGPLRFNLQMWIYPFVTEGDQIIASTDLSIQSLNVESRDLGLHFGLKDNALTFAIHKGCTCQPCPGVLSMTSWKSKIMPHQWQHVSFIYPFAEGYTDNPAVMAIHVDAILRDVREFRDVVVPDIAEPMELKLLLGQGSTQELDEYPYDGLIYDVRWTNSSYYSHLVKKTMQCPPLSRSSETYFELNEGGGNLGAAGALMGTQHMWVNASHDDMTSRASTTFYGDMIEHVSGEVGRFVITSRTACAKKRVVGGDNYEVTFTDEQGVETSLPVVDTNDGNYHVSYSNYTCMTYSTKIVLDQEVLHEFPIRIFPGKTDPTKTFVVGGVPTPHCFGVQTEFDIQAVDEFGCYKQDHLDTFVVMFDGPHRMHAVVTPKLESGGLYRVTFVPQAPGDYHMTMYMLGEGDEQLEILTGIYFCISVCPDGSLRLNGANGVVVQEDLPGVSDLDLSFPAVTMEAWIKIPSGFSSEEPAYILHKGGMDQLGQFTKTYALSVSPVAGHINASVYVGLGQLRELNASPGLTVMPQEQWLHVAVVYSGTRLELFLNGDSTAQADFDDAMSVNNNSYLHPLEMGINFPGGLLDEVKLWKVARSQDEIQDSMYCAPYQHLEHVAAYFSFNEGAGEVASGHGAQCPPMGDLATVGMCLQGSVVESEASFSSDTPTTTAGEGYNAASSRYSHFFGAGLTEYPAGSWDQMYTVWARDKCNYVYTKNDSTAFRVRTQEYEMVYWDERPPTGIEYPIMYPPEATMSEPVYATPSASRQCPGDPAPNPLRGDVFHGYLGTEAVEPTRKAGTYLLSVEVDEVPTREPMLLSVVANEPHHFYVAPVDAGFSGGVPGAFKVQMKDKNDNTIYREMRFTAEMTLLARSDNEPAAYSLAVSVTPEEMYFDAASGFYTVFVTLAQPGTYSLILVGAEHAARISPYTSTFEVKPAAWRKLLTTDLKVPTPTRRFEHTSAVYNGDIYIFGGVLYDRTYLNDMYVLKSSGPEEADVAGVEDMLSYKKTVSFEYLLPVERDVTVEVRVDTAELIAANRMNPTCLDVVFTLPNNGEELDFYLDPIGEHPTVPGRCNSNATLYFVKLPAGTVSPSHSQQMIEMYYGNPSLGMAGEMENEYNDPKSVFYLYEGFEDGTVERSLFDYVSPCLGYEMDEPVVQNFVVTQQLPYAGESSLYAQWGGMGVLVARVPIPVTNYKLRAWFYDSDATNSSHFISPDFPLCDDSATEDDKPILPDGQAAMGHLEAVSTAVGTYTMSHLSKYCVASPWESTIHRYAGWHLFEVVSVDNVHTVSIDNQVVKQSTSSVFEPRLDKVMISAGFNAYGIKYPGLHLNHAFWDEVSVALVEPGVKPTEVPSMEEDETVAMGAGRGWYKVNATGAPPPRYAHSAVVYEDTMYVFGGERSGFAFNDIWAFSFETSKWSFVTPKSGHIPAPRYDHVAAVSHDGMMIIHGGRNSMQLLGDMWVFDLKAMMWTRLAEMSDVGPRFGHAAAIPEDSSHIYILGGYGEQGFSREFFRCKLTDGECEDLTYGCSYVEVAPMVANSSGFLPETLTQRYEHTAFADRRFLYVYGGASITETYGFGGVYKFSIAECSWEEIPTSTDPPVRRYEHVAGLLKGGFYVHGGHAGGNYFDDAYFFPV